MISLSGVMIIIYHIKLSCNGDYMFKREIKITQDFINYGLDLSYEVNANNTVDPMFWLRKSNYKIYDGEKLIEKGKYKSVYELKKSKKYITLYKTDIVVEEKDFVEKFYPELEKDILDILKKYPKYNYDSAFYYIISKNSKREEHWCKYLKERLIADAVSWCEKYNLRYAIDNNLLSV